MEDYVKSMKPVNLSKGGRVDVNSQKAKIEIAYYQRLAGEMFWLGSGIFPQASYFGSIKQQRISHLKGGQNVEPNQTLKIFRKYQHYICFNLRKQTVTTWKFLHSPMPHLTPILAKLMGKRASYVGLDTIQGKIQQRII